MSSTVAGPAGKKKKKKRWGVYKIQNHSLHREKYSVFPASALALSTALLMANRTEELRASGGSPTARENYQAVTIYCRSWWNGLLVLLNCKILIIMLCTQCGERTDVVSYPLIFYLTFHSATMHDNSSHLDPWLAHVSLLGYCYQFYTPTISLIAAPIEIHIWNPADFPTWDGHTIATVNYYLPKLYIMLPFDPKTPTGLGASLSSSTLKSIGMSFDEGGLYSCRHWISLTNMWR